MAHDKTEKATPKKREESRKKGQVARSADVNGAAILMSGLLALSAFGPSIMARMEQAMLEVMARIQHPEVVSSKGIGSLFLLVGQNVGLAVLPVVGVCAVAALAAGGRPGGRQPALDGLQHASHP